MTPSSLGFSGDTRLMDPSVPCSQDLYVAEALSTLESWRSRYNQVVKDKGDLELEIIVLNEYVCVRRGRVGQWEEGVCQCTAPGNPRQLTSLTQLPSGLLLSGTASD